MLTAESFDMIQRTLRMAGMVAAAVIIFGPLSSLVIWSFAEKWYWPHLFPQQVGFFYWAKVLQGDMPSPISPPSGCHFHPRCPYKRDLCTTGSPVLEEKRAGRRAACHFSREIFS